MSVLRIELPEAFDGIFDPYRYKVFYGGRGGGKSHSIGRYLLARGMSEATRILCARELQNSIDESVHRLLADIIAEYRMDDFYEVQRQKIIGKNGTEFIFKGLKHNPVGIKSTEGVDVVWVEEAEAVSDNSWEILIPTIRKEGSEIVISFNPKLPSDPTWIRMVENANDDMLVRKISWQDNPYFPAVLNEERLKLKKSDIEAYEHVWEGNFDRRYHGGIYASLIEKARDQDRITSVPYDPAVPVVTAWDLGNANATAIWFAQMVGKEARVIDFYENSNQPLTHYANYVLEKDYNYEMHYLPHDAAHERLGMQGSIADQLRELGIRNEVIKVISIEAGIEKARNLIGKCFFDKDSCRDGLHALSHHQYEWDQNRQRFKDKPLKDWSSDAADSFRYLAQVMEESKTTWSGPQIVSNRR